MHTVILATILVVKDSPKNWYVFFGLFLTVCQ